MLKVIARLMLVLLVATLFLASDSKALLAEQNDNIQITRMSTEILPEYDTPDILVVNSIQLKNNSDKDYSGELRWIIPKDSKTHIVIDQNTSQEQIPFDLVQNNGNTEMVWKLSKPLKAGEVRPIHLEFYFNNFQGNVDKSFTFEHIQTYPVIFSQLYIYQPTKATNFKMNPEMGPPQAGQFTSYQKTYSNLSPGQKISQSVSYSKTDPNPSVTAPPNGSSGQNQVPNQNNVSSQKSFGKNTGIFIIAGLAILIVLLAVKIISNNRRINEMADYEMDYEDSEDDFNDENDDDDDDSENEIGQIGNRELTGERAKVEKDFKAGRITEEEYYLKLEELE